MPRRLSAKYRKASPAAARRAVNTAPPAPGGAADFFAAAVGTHAGFQERFFTSNPETVHGREWGSYLARVCRYEVFWAHYEGNVYRTIHLWANTVKENYELYSAIRSIRSPAYRIGEFWAEHVYGGVLDPVAGDGTDVASAIPILTPNPKLRAAIARVWEWSDWKAEKDDWVRMGAVLGDAPLMVVDDEARQEVYLKPVHPRAFWQLDTDHRGNVTGYRIIERRPDPRAAADPLQWGLLVTYKEVCTKVGDRVRFQTFLDDEPYDWHDYPDPDSPLAGRVWDWTESYGAVPLVFVRHRTTPGSVWGMGELHTILSKMMELDGQASHLSDQVAKMVDAPWLFCGVAGADDLTVTYPEPDDDSPQRQPHRTRIPVLYASDPAAKAQALVNPLAIGEVSAHVKSIADELALDHPEIGLDSDNVSGEASGRARRVAREKVEARVVARRSGYDDGLRRALQLAIHIAASKGYGGFEDFTADSLAAGELDFSIGDRPVFAVDTLDHLEEVQARATALQTLTVAGVPLPVAMLQCGYQPETVAQAVRVNDLQRRQLTQEADAAQAKQAVVAAHGAAVAATAKAAAVTGAALPLDQVPDVNDVLTALQRVEPHDDSLLKAGFSVLGIDPAAGRPYADDHAPAAHQGSY